VTLNENTLKKVSAWLPLFIAAGYFLFLVATWQQFLTANKAIDERFNKFLAEVEKGNGSERTGDDSSI
jgi:hypothetical protein